MPSADGYSKRISFCTPDEVDKTLSRRVYMFASLTWALPYLILTLVDATQFADPRTAYNNAGWLHVAVIIFLFWSLYTSYASVRTVFGVRRVSGMCWFLFLPGLAYLLMIVGVAGAVLSMPANVDHPISFRSTTMSFDYPGNWWIDEADAEYDPDYAVDIEAPQDAYFGILLYEMDDVESALDSTLTGVARVVSERERRPLDTLGGFEGRGVELRGTLDGSAYRIWCFVAPVGQGMLLEMTMISADVDWELVEPGMRQIIQSLHILLPER